MIDQRSYRHNLSSCEYKIKPEKKADLKELRFRPEFFPGFNFTTTYVVCITAMINHVFISFSAFQICDLLYIHLHLTALLTRRLIFTSVQV